MELDRIYFLGSGGRFGLACELNLKMKEMSLTHSEAFHFMEFRHGPKAMVNRNTLIVGLVSETNAKHELAVLKDTQDLGAEIVTMGENNVDISFNSGLEEVFRNILYLPFGQMMAYERSIAKGLDPDHPNNLDSIVKL
jgi:glucosamine--fructose-6-phosphate aminotransferase (isomerizing)